MRQRRPRYRHVDAALLRASVHSPDVAAAIPWPGPYDERRPEPWLEWLRRVWQDPQIVESVTVASPVLGGQVQAVLDGARHDLVKVRRLALALGRYLARMRGRATPFGLFAGVAPIEFDDAGSVVWTGAHRPRVRADAAWLADVVTRLESFPHLLARLTVVANDLAVVRGGRLIVPTMPAAHEPGGRVRVDASVVHSEPVQAVLRAARTPVVVGDVIAMLFADSVAPASMMLAQLVALGVLVTNLRPPSTIIDGLSHVLHELDAADATTVATVAPLVTVLHQAHAKVRAAEQPHWLDGAGRWTAAAQLRQIADVSQPLMVDLRLGCAVTLPQRVATEAVAAADALLRLAPNPHGDPGWRAYRYRFLDRYGPGAVVPLEDLVDPTRGIGYPDHFTLPAGSVAPAELSPRDEAALALAQQAALDGATEVVLDDAAIDALAGHGAAQPRPAPHLDLCFDIRAKTVPDIAAGTFTIAVAGIGRTALATSGRFLDLVHDDLRDIAALSATLPVTVCGALPVQLSFAALDARTGNVLRAPRLLPDLLPVGEHLSGRDHLDVRDLAVTGDVNRLYLLSQSRRRVVEPVLANAAARHAMPPLVRLLAELAASACTPVSLVDWGAADRLPFRPRLRYGRIILSPARWRITAKDLPDPTATSAEWDGALDRLRERLRLPAQVTAGPGDQRLRLNLTEPMDRALLRAHLHRAGGPVVLVEAPSPEDHGWLGGRAHEILLPLALDDATPASPPAALRGHGPVRPLDRADAALPGAPILNAKLYSHPDLVDIILIDHLPRLLAAWEIPPMWWFVRYEDPAPHLRLRLHSDDYGQAANRVGAWATALCRQGLIGDLTLATYRPETGRFGSGPAMAAAEALFAADSAAAVAQLGASAGLAAPQRQALTAASLVDLTGAVTGDRAAGLRWLLERPDLAAGTGGTDRVALRRTLTLTHPDEGHATLAALPGGTTVLAAWKSRQDTAAAYTARLDDTTHVTATTVLTALLHLHHVRVHGLAPVLEARTHRLARAAALADTARALSAKDRP